MQTYSFEELMWAALEAFDSLPYTVPVRWVVRDERGGGPQRSWRLSCGEEPLVDFITRASAEACRMGLRSIELVFTLGAG